MGSRENQTFLESSDDSAVNDVSETNEADKKKEESSEDKTPGTSEDETNRDRCPRGVLRRCLQNVLDGVCRNLGHWIVEFLFDALNH